MLSLSLIQRRLRLVYGLLPTFALILPSGLFPRPFKFAALLFPFEGESGLSLCRLVDGAGGIFFALRPSDFRAASLVRCCPDRWAVRRARRRIRGSRWVA